LRVHQLAREFNANLEGRVDERLRVARELHDTLLQSFHGLLPRLQAAVNLLPGRASDARQVLEAAVDDAAHAITEARDAVQDMRSSVTSENDLAKAVEAMGQELAAHHRDATGDAPAFSLEVEGAAQDLHPILRDEIYRIASEALRNAFQHARAQGIEVEIRYHPRQLRVRLRDDGIGIDAEVLRQEGREGHFGLRGMRERAKGIGGKLEIWSEQGAGTEVELIVPASVAYAGQTGRRSGPFRSKVGTNS
jgi:signal transduction histidine kinase